MKSVRICWLTLRLVRSSILKARADLKEKSAWGAALTNPGLYVVFKADAVPAGCGFRKSASAIRYD